MKRQQLLELVEYIGVCVCLYLYLYLYVVACVRVFSCDFAHSVFVVRICIDRQEQGHIHGARAAGADRHGQTEPLQSAAAQATRQQWRSAFSSVFVVFAYFHVFLNEMQ